MTKLRFHIRFLEEKIHEPIIYEIGHEYQVVTSIRRADVRETTGWMDVEFSGETEEIERAIEGIRNKGVLVDPIELNFVECAFSPMDLTDEQIERYSRHIILSDVGGKGQQKLCEAKVLVIGAGGLGSPAALYLAAAGIGTLGLVDGDVVDLSNLQRQILHTTSTVGTPKVQSGSTMLSALNPEVTVKTYGEHINADNIMGILESYDVVLDGSDNFGTRFLVNDACYFAKKTLVSGSIFRFEGQLTTIKPHEGFPCYRCLYPEPPPAGLVPNCQEAGVLGVLAGTIGVLQANEVIKEILGLGETLADRLLIYDALEMKFRKVGRPKDPQCPLCRSNPSITTFQEHHVSCSV